MNDTGAPLSAGASVALQQGRRPYATATIMLLSGAGFILQLLWPPAIGLLQWDAARVAQGEVWRLFTVILVHTNGVPHIALNLAILMVLGPYVEQRWSRWAWMAGFWAGVFAAEAVGVSWLPVGGGNSVGLGGVFGLGLVGLLADPRVSRSARLAVPIASFVIAVFATLAADIHGPPIFAGALVGLAALPLGARRSGTHRPHV